MSRRRRVLITAALLAGAVGLAGNATAATPPAAASAPATPAAAGPAPDAPGQVVFDEGEASLVGTPSRPTRDVAAVKERQSLVRDPRSRASVFPGTRLTPSRSALEAPLTATATATPTPTATTDARGGTYTVLSGYRTSTTPFLPIAVGKRPYESTTLTRAGGYGTVDATGVRMFRFGDDTTLWNHPVGQAQYILNNLNSYRLNPDPRYLDIATKNAQRLVDRRVESADAWYYPYDFDFAVHGDTTQTLRAPWYSGMAQGLALGAFTRLFQVTKDPRWLEAADRTYLSLVQAPKGDAPFASWIDGGGRVWFEEYPRYPVSHGERVLNGHIYAMFGVHDYWQLTGQRADVARILSGALYTVGATNPAEFRRPNWASVYSLFHQKPTVSYHAVHIRQFLILWRMTKNPRWAVTANTYRSDFPQKNVAGSAIITAGTKTIYRLDSQWRVVATRKVTFARQTSAPYATRHRIQGGPRAMRISAGTYTGWWFPEAYGVAYPRGAVDVHAFDPKVRLVFGAGKTYTAYRLDYRGLVVGTKRLTVTRQTSAPATSNAVVQGRPAWRIGAGALAGYYVPFQSRLSPGYY